MISNLIEEYIIDSEAFQEKEVLVLGTSGLPLFYFINTEKLMADQGRWEGYGNSSRDMIIHSLDAWSKSPYGQVIVQIAEEIKNLLPKDLSQTAISGYQRRDWIFSGPVAALLKLPHYSIYKNGHWEKIVFKNSQVHCEKAREVNGMNFFHVSDLMTAGSSAITGWIPEMKKNNAKVSLLVNVVSRLQGGEEKLKKEGVPVKSMIKIDRDFLERHSRFPERTLKYFDNPSTTILEYLQEKGLVDFLVYFDPKPKNLKLPRAIKFYQNWKSCVGAPQLEAFDRQLIQSYGKTADDITKEFNEKI